MQRNVAMLLAPVWPTRPTAQPGGQAACPADELAPARRRRPGANPRLAAASNETEAALAAEVAQVGQDVVEHRRVGAEPGQRRVAAIGQPALDGAAEHQVVVAPGVVAAGAVWPIWLPWVSKPPCWAK